MACHRLSTIFLPDIFGYLGLAFLQNGLVTVLWLFSRVSCECNDTLMTQIAIKRLIKRYCYVGVCVEFTLCGIKVKCCEIVFDEFFMFIFLPPWRPKGCVLKVSVDVNLYALDKLTGVVSS